MSISNHTLHKYREIASKNFPGGADTKAQRPFPRFLVKLSELCPRLVHKQMVVLQTHLDSEVCFHRQRHFPLLY